MDHRRFSLKKRWISNTTRKHNLSESAPISPAPSIPFHNPRTLNKSQECVTLPLNMDGDPHTPIAAKNGNPLPTSPSFDSEEETAVGEPLVQDFATSSIPKEYKPFTARGAETASVEAPTEIHVPIISSDDETITVSPASSHRAIRVPVRTSSSSQRAPSQRAFSQSKRQVANPSSASSAPTTPESRVGSSADSVMSYETQASSIHTLPPLQVKSALSENDRLEPVLEDDPASFDLVPQVEGERRTFSLEKRSEQMFSAGHLQEIFGDPSFLLRFTSFLSSSRPKSIPVLIYYLDALKALRAISYANAIAEALEPIEGYDFSEHPARLTMNSVLEEKANQAFNALVKDDLPAFITHTFIQVVSVSIQRRITGTLPPHLRETSEGLAEVFCLTDPSRPDNPIVFASEEFHRTTQYGVSYAIGRNCRFLQGPRTNPNSVQRLRKAIDEGREVNEVFLNYRRDGSPFMNLLMVAPLLDSRGNIRYFIGAQVDVSGLCKECTDLQGLQRLLVKQEIENDSDNQIDAKEESRKDEFQELSEMLNQAELDMVRKYGGRMHHEQIDEPDDVIKRHDRPRLLIKDPSNDLYKSFSISGKANGNLEGIYKNYLLVRPYPSLRILFSSPALRLPGMLQTPFLSRIGGSSRVREELTAALAEGRGVTAKVRWISGHHGDEEGRARWIHCTPLLGQNGSVGVWMIVLVDDEASVPIRRFRVAPPIASDIGSKGSFSIRDKSDEKSRQSGISSRTKLGPRRRSSQDAVHRLPKAERSSRPSTSHGGTDHGDSLHSFALD